jgi:hypothetical protein
MHLSDILKEISIERGDAARNTSVDIITHKIPVFT